jgi:hypothetical protein
MKGVNNVLNSEIDDINELNSNIKPIFVVTYNNADIDKCKIY